MARRSLLPIALAVGMLAVPQHSEGTLRNGAGATPPRSHQCTATLVVRQTAGAAGCWIDEHVTHIAGTLSYPCTGGAATARFGQTVFAGDVTNGVATLRLRTHFHYSDGCDWETAQKIRGSVRGPAMDFNYQEFPAEGQQHCAHACEATATVVVTPH